MKRQNSIQILCRLSDRYAVGLTDIRENIGHDDSLPFQANVFVWCRDLVPEQDNLQSFKRTGAVWNDGWGGDSVIQTDTSVKDAKDYMSDIETLASKHLLHFRGMPLGKYTLQDLLTIMAEAWLTAEPKSVKNKTLEYRFDDDPVVIRSNGKYQVTIFNN